MTTGNKIMWRRGEIASNFSSFPHYFIYNFLTSGVKLHIHLLNVVVQFIVFLTLSTLICLSTDISKCFSESLGTRDNESRLYLLNSELFKSELFNIFTTFEPRVKIRYKHIYLERICTTYDNSNNPKFKLIRLIWFFSLAG